MGGCFRRLGCLILLVILICVAWIMRDVWLPARFRSTPISSVGWQPASNTGADRAQAALNRLNQASGPATEVISAGDLVSLIRRELGPRLQGRVDSLSGVVEDHRFSLRGRVDFSQFHGALGTAGILFTNGEMVQLTGVFNVIKPGLAEFQVLGATVGRVALPSGAIPRIIQEIDRGKRAPGMHADALPLPMPTSVSDIRVANGKVTLYKNAK